MIFSRPPAGGFWSNHVYGRFSIRNLTIEWKLILQQFLTIISSKIPKTRPKRRRFMNIYYSIYRIKALIMLNQEMCILFRYDVSGTFVLNYFQFYQIMRQLIFTYIINLFLQQVSKHLNWSATKLWFILVKHLHLIWLTVFTLFVS